MSEKTERNKEIVRRVRDTDESLKSIAADYDIGSVRVSQIASKHGVRRDQKPSVGDRAVRSGEPVIYRPDHDRAWSSGWVPERYLVAQTKLGRPLKSDEIAVITSELEDGEELGEDDVEVRTRSEHARIVGSESWKYDDPTELIVALQWLAVQLGRTPRAVDINERLPYSHGTYYSKFGSLTAAQEIAGLRPNEVGGRVPSELPETFTDRYGHLEEHETPQAAVQAAKA